MCKALKLVERLPDRLRLPIEDMLIFLFWRDSIERVDVPSVPPEQVEYEVALFHNPTSYERRRIRKARNGGKFTKRDRERLLRRDRCCLCCGATEGLTADHIVPLARGGADSFHNMQILCQSCNSRKGVQIIDYRKR